MKKYRLSVTEEIGGYIEVNAENVDQAEALAEDLLDEYGADELFFPSADNVDRLSKYNADHTHGDRGVFSCEEITNEDYNVKSHPEEMDQKNYPEEMDQKNYE